MTTNNRSTNQNLQRTYLSNKDFRERISLINKTFKSSVEKHRNNESTCSSIKKYPTSKRIETDKSQSTINNIKVKKRLESGKSSQSNSVILNSKVKKNSSSKPKHAFPKDKNVLDYNLERIKKFPDEKYRNTVLSNLSMSKNESNSARHKDTNSSKIEYNNDLNSISDFKEGNVNRIITTENSFKKDLVDDYKALKPSENHEENEKSKISIPPLKFPCNINENLAGAPFTQRGGESSKRNNNNKHFTSGLKREQTWNDTISMNTKTHGNNKAFNNSSNISEFAWNINKNHTQTFSQQNTPRHIMDRFTNDLKNVPHIRLERTSTNSAEKNRKKFEKKSNKSVKNFNPLKYQTKKVIRGQGLNDDILLNDQPGDKLSFTNDKETSVQEINISRNEEINDSNKKIKDEKENEDSDKSDDPENEKIPETKEEIKEKNQSLIHINLPSSSNTPKDNAKNICKLPHKEINSELQAENDNNKKDEKADDVEVIEEKKQLNIFETKTISLIIEFLDSDTLKIIRNKSLFKEKLSSQYHKDFIKEKIKLFENRISKINEKTPNVQSLADEKLSLNRGATKAMELLNNENHYKIFEDKIKVPPSDNLLVFRIYFIVIGKEDRVFDQKFKLIEDHVFWEDACDYFMGFKGSLGFKLISDVSKVSVDLSMLMKIQNMIDGKFNSSSTAAYNKSCPTTGIFYFFIKEILEYYGILCERRFNAFNALKFATYSLQYYSKLSKITEMA